jgi:hypothetical protein
MFTLTLHFTKDQTRGREEREEFFFKKPTPFFLLLF